MPTEAQLLMLDKNQIEPLLQSEDVLNAVKDAFILHSQKQGRIFPVIREPLSTGGVFGIKSGDVPSQDLLGFKAAGFWPNNRSLGGEPHQATILLFSPHTGRPLCIIDGNAITTMRTGAAGALGLQLLAHPDSKTLCIFGTGVQATIQLEFALRLFPRLEQIHYLTYNNQPDFAFEQKFASLCPLTHSTAPDASVANSDIIITATPGGGALFSLDAVSKGTHINCVGADTKGKRELPEGLLNRVKLFVDDATQATQIGETQWSPHTHCIELGELLSGTTAFQRTPDDITLFDMTGLALQDLTVARMLYQQALKTNVGTLLSWPW
ncbi:MAG: ornithine cyclodeaminase family protein [Saezia sp.]